MVDFPTYKPADFGNALASGARAGYLISSANRQNELDRRADEAAQYVEPAMQGDQSAFIKLAVANPQAGNAVATMLGRLDAQKAAKVKQAADFTTQVGMGVLSAPPDQQGAAYATAMAEAKARGIDTSAWPQTWSPAAKGWVQYHVNQARPVKDYFDSQSSALVPLGPGGTPGAPPSAPGAGFTGKVSSGESGGSYTAANPSGAYGKFQFMPETWATVAQANPSLGLPFNMKQATPQQQEAAFQALTQMNGAGLKANGIPVSEASLYLAHRFGVQGATTFLKAPDDTPLAQIFPSSWIQQNPDLRNATVGQFKQGVLSRFGSQPVGQSVDVAATPPASGGTIATPPPGTAVAGTPAAMPPGPSMAPGMPPPSAMPQPQVAGVAPPNATGQGDSVPPGQPPQPEARDILSLVPPGATPLGDPKTRLPKIENGYLAVQYPNGTRGWVQLPSRSSPAQPAPPSGYRWITGADGRSALEAIPGGPAATGSTDNPEGLTGEAFLATLPSDRAAQVKALYEGRMALSPRLQASKQGKQLMSDLLNAYPNDYDSILSGQRQKTANDFSAGTAAKNITALNTAIQHMGELHDLAKKLDNGSFGLLNRAKNFAAKETGDADITNFEIAKHAVAEELSRVFKGSSLSDAEIKAWEDKVSSSMSPSQLQGVLDEATKLLGGRLEALGDQYTRGMGKSVPAITLLSPEAQRTLQRIQSDPIDGSRREPGPGEKGKRKFDLYKEYGLE